MKTKKYPPIDVPCWYPLEVYKKNLSARELLDEICKRYELDNYLTPVMSQQQKEVSFLEIILQNKIIPASIGLKDELARSIKPMSVFEVLNMANQVRKSSWYETLEDKYLLEEVLSRIEKRLPLNGSHKIIMEKYCNVPWHIFQAHPEEKKWCQFAPSLGIPVTIDIGIDRKSIMFELRNLLTKMLGKKLWALSPDIFESWQRKNILAIFDLQAWFKIKNINYKKIDLAQIIWGNNPPGSPVEKDSTVDMKAFINNAIRESRKVIQIGTIRPLWLYCENEIRLKRNP